MKLKILALASAALLASGCVTQAEKFARMSPVEIQEWSDEELCTNGYRKNPAIKAELLKRNLVTEQEFEYIFLSNQHYNFPAKGMRKCAMWTFSNWRELLSKTKLPDGSIQEIWKIHKGEYIVFLPTGGEFYQVTVLNDRITDVSPPLEK